MSHHPGKTDMAALTVVTVSLIDRDDGGLRVWSDDLPGLILAGADRQNVADCIVPAIAALFEHQGHRVTVKPAQAVRDFLNGSSPREVDVHVNHVEGSARSCRFVIEADELEAA